MSVETPIDPEAPVKLAWDEYRLTDAYENTRKWATHEEHTQGSLWAAFCQGWTRYPGEETKVSKLAARVAELEGAARELVEMTDLVGNAFEGESSDVGQAWDDLRGPLERLSALVTESEAAR